MTNLTPVLMFWFCLLEVPLMSHSSNISLHLGAYYIVFSKLFINYHNNPANTVLFLFHR